MDQAKEFIGKIRLSVMILKEKLDFVRQENSHLIEKNNALNAENQLLKSKIDDLENKNINLQLSKSFKAGSLGSTDLKQRLDEFIKEIDECITLLSE